MNVKKIKAALVIPRLLSRNVSALVCHPERFLTAFGMTIAL